MKNLRTELNILIGSFLALLLFGAIASYVESYLKLSVLVGAFGASTAIVFNSPNESISRYKNLALGYLISCFIGISFNFFFGANLVFLKVALAVSFSIFAMRIAKSFHPAGGAIALLSVILPFKESQELIYYFIGTSLIGPTIFFCIVLLVRKFFNFVED